MSNILPKKSWHIHNDKNREKVKKDEVNARIEKERTDERAKIAEKEHRLSLLRSRANVNPTEKTVENVIDKNKDFQQKPQRFELFEMVDGFKDEIKGDYEKNLEIKNLSHKDRQSYHKKLKSSENVEKDHWKHDPIYDKKQSLKKKSNYGNNKDYSFV